MKKTFILILVLGMLLAMGVQAQSSSSGRQVAELLADSYRGETLLLVKILGEIELDGRITIESRDRSRREVAEVRHVYGSYVLLKGELKNEYLQGSRIYQ